MSLVEWYCTKICSMKNQEGATAPTEALVMNTLDKAYRYFNDALFDGKLPPCILTIARKKNTHGYFAPKRWRRVEESDYATHEIALTATTLYRKPIEVFSTLVHEQVHLWQQEFGKPSRGGYHNTQWGHKMEEVGLMPSNTGRPGGKKTGQQMTHYIIAGGPYERAFNVMPEEYLLAFTSLDADIQSAQIKRRVMPSDPTEPTTGTVAAPKTGKSRSKVKYTCPCGYNVWGKPALLLLCQECESEFVPQ